MSNSNINPPPDLDPEQLTRLLELELAHKRTEWQRSGTRARSARINAIAFLVILIVGSAIAFFFLFSRVSEQRASHQPSPSATEAPR
ncbi:MAG: hypothetical protein QOG48_1911 [Verrucomicrobiota bacterium]|jgi:hypothetical protein